MNSTPLTKENFSSDQMVRWCPGCGDYAILAALQRTLPQLGIPKEDFVLVSGIGCSSRLIYYMDTYGFHTIHGRAPVIATGIKIANPRLSVWVISGDGDSFSIGGNHLIHLLRRNLDINLIIINNQIYGLTKGQFSPTSQPGKKTKSSPFGSVEEAINPLDFLLSSKASFVARTLDKDLQNMQKVFTEAYHHQGSSVVEVYQNCNIFNHNEFIKYTAKETRFEESIFLEEGEELIFSQQSKGIYLDQSYELQTINLAEAKKRHIPLLRHQSEKNSKLLSKIYPIMSERTDLPTPFGIFRKEKRPTFEEQFDRKISNDDSDLELILKGNHSWQVK